jgi:glutathione S-transferase
MKLIGMLDSPYVRRVAISLHAMDIAFEHNPLSVFRTFDAFHAINPVVKAPTLVCDDGTVLMDSTLILDYIDTLYPEKSLMPNDLAARTSALRTIGLALAACEKSVQIYYEHNLRPAERQHQPWVDRTTAQLRDAYRCLEDDLAAKPLSADANALTQAGITLAVAWYFTQQYLPGKILASDHPRIAAHADLMERTPAFLAAPFLG